MAIALGTPKGTVIERLAARIAAADAIIASAPHIVKLAERDREHAIVELALEQLALAKIRLGKTLCTNAAGKPVLPYEVRADGKVLARPTDAAGVALPRRNPLVLPALELVPVPMPVSESPVT